MALIGRFLPPCPMKILQRLTNYLLPVVFVFAVSPCVLADAKSDYESKCSVCHGFGIAGAPKPGDTADWRARVAKGMRVIYSNAINGFTGNTGVMPPKGGFTDLSDAQIRAIVDYMIGGK